MYMQEKIMKYDFDELKAVVERAWDDRTLLDSEEIRAAIRATVDAVDKGELRCAEPVD
mgnify:FL=1